MNEKLKRKLITIWRISVSGFHNFFRNAWLTTAATAIMVVTLTIVLSAIVINFALNDTIRSAGLGVSVFILDDANEVRQEELRQTLVANDNVVMVEYRPKDEAARVFQDRFREDEALLDALALSGEGLPASYEVQIEELDRIDEVIDIANEERFAEIVEETSVNETRREVIDQAAAAQRFITTASVIAGAVFGGISVLIIFNTIRMAIFTRSEEIKIMKLIGATPGYIRGPFLFEAAMYGVIAAIVAFSIVYSAILGLSSQSSVSYIELEGTVDTFANNWLLVFVLMIAGGVFVGLVSSSLAIARHLRLKKW